MEATVNKHGNLYVVSDVHSFFSSLKRALEEAGFFDDPTGKLVLLGDAFDRGEETLELMNFLLKLLKEDRLIYIRGNHEDLLEDLVRLLSTNNYKYMMDDFNRNHTTDTVISIANMYYDDEADCLKYYGKDDWQYMDYEKVMLQPLITVELARESVYYKKLRTYLNYYETEHYVFCHGWVPTDLIKGGTKDVCVYNPSWRSEDMDWRRARWTNGMEACVRDGAAIPGKTVICGHFHTGWGHIHLHGNDERNKDPFLDYGIIAIDGGTYKDESYDEKRVNCIVINEKEQAIFRGEVIFDPADL